MKNISRLISFSFIALLLMSCAGGSNPFKSDEPENLTEEDFKEVSAGNYTVSIPTYLIEANNLNADASLQYQNVFKGSFMIVIDESKEEIINIFTELGEYNEELSVAKNYSNIQMKFISEGINITNQSEPKSLKVNGLDCEVIDIQGLADGVEDEVAYTLGFIEGAKEVYMIMCWTVADRKEQFAQTFRKIIRSFKVTEAEDTDDEGIDIEAIDEEELEEVTEVELINP